MGDSTVRLEALDGRWEVAGAERYPEVVPESVSVQSDPGGFAVCSFQLHRPDLWLPSADLTAWTPCEIDEGEARLFEGWVHETPISGEEGVISVAGRGWQYELDGDPIQPLHLQTDLAIFKDPRSIYGYNIGFHQAGTVEISSGGITIGWPKGSSVPAGNAVGVVADFGDVYDRDAIPRAMAIEFDTVNTTATFHIFVRATDTIDGMPGSGATDYFSEPLSSGLNRRYNVIATRRRFLHIFLWSPGAAGPTGFDHLARIKRLWLAADPENIGSQGKSLLHASDVARQAVTRAAPKLKIDPVDLPNAFADEVKALLPWRWYRPGVVTPYPGAGLIGIGISDQSGNSGDVLTPTGGAYFASNGSPSYDTSGPLESGEQTGRAVLGTISGAGEWFILPGQPVSADWTIGVIYKTSSSWRRGVSPGNFRQGIGLVSAVGAAGSNDWGLALVGGVLHAGTGNPDTTIRDTITTDDDEWHVAHFVRVAKTGQLALYRDGQLVGSSSGASLATLNAMADGRIGCHRTPTNGDTTSLVGSVAEIAFWAEAFGARTVATLARAAVRRPKSRIRTTLLRLESFPPSQPRTARELIDAANAFHGYRARVIRDRTFTFEPQPSLPKYAIGPWAADRFQDTSAGSAEEMFNAVEGAATGFDGSPVRVRRYSSDLPEAPARPVSSPAPASSTLAADPGFVSVALTGTFRRGRTYRIRGRHTQDATPGGVISRHTAYVRNLDNPAGDYRDLVVVNEPGGTVAFEIVWSPKEDVTNAAFEWVADIAAGDVTGLHVALGQYTVLDRRDRIRPHRLELGFQTTAEVLAAFADAFLRAHRKTPLRGSIPIGPGDLLNLRTGEIVHPRQLVCEEGELIHFHAFTDPDSGDSGRDGAIASVTYDPATEVASVSIDSQRDNFEKLLQRYAATTGGQS